MPAQRLIQQDRWGHPINREGYPLPEFGNDNTKIYDDRIPLCKCGHRREDHAPYEGNWTCHATGHKCLPIPKHPEHSEDCECSNCESKELRYCFCYESSDPNLSYAQQLTPEPSDNDGGEKQLTKQNRLKRVVSLGSAQNDLSEIVKRGSSSARKSSRRKPKLSKPSSVSKQGRRSKNQSERLRQGGTPSMKTSPKSDLSLCPRCRKRNLKFKCISERDMKTYICKECRSLEISIDKRKLSKIATTELLLEESFQRKIGLNYLHWITHKRQQERRVGVK
jgi:hypothetical protein